MILARQQRYSVDERTRRLLKLIAAKSADEMKKQVEFLSAWVFLNLADWRALDFGLRRNDEWGP